jgi:starvation-inducible DNA-binding protein
MATGKQHQPVKSGGTAAVEAQPILNQRGKGIQPYGTLVYFQLALSDEARQTNVDALNQILADSMHLRDLYLKYHWQVAGPTFFELHRLFRKNFKKQSRLVEKLGHRVQLLGGVSVATPHDVAEMTKIERAPRDREQVPVELSRLLDGHELILKECHEATRTASANGDEGTAELLADHIIRHNEKQVWLLSEHLVNTPLVSATAARPR